MYPNKGVIRPGADGDVVIFDPNIKRIISHKTHHHNLDFNIFEGMEAWGMASHTFSHGRLLWDGKNFYNQGKGKYLHRKNFGFPFARHSNYVKANDPMNWKVDRSNFKKDEPVEQKSEPLAASERSELKKLQ